MAVGDAKCESSLGVVARQQEALALFDREISFEARYAAGDDLQLLVAENYRVSDASKRVELALDARDRVTREARSFYAVLQKLFALIADLISRTGDTEPEMKVMSTHPLRLEKADSDDRVL